MNKSWTPYAIFGLPFVGLCVFLSRPFIAYFSRETCYAIRGEIPFWSNPLKSSVHSISSLYQCEWMGHWGFQWQDSMQWLSERWQGLAASIGTLGGGYALWKGRQGEPENKSEVELQKKLFFMYQNARPSVAIPPVSLEHRIDIHKIAEGVKLGR